MAVTIAALALLNAVLVLPFAGLRDQHRLARVTLLRACGAGDCWTRMASPGDYETARAGLAGLEGLAAYATGEVAVALPEPRAVAAVIASTNYFDVLGVTAAAGRTFGAADAAARAPVAVVGHGFWARVLGSDPNAIGRTIRPRRRSRRARRRRGAAALRGARPAASLGTAPHRARTGAGDLAADLAGGGRAPAARAGGCARRAEPAVRRAARRRRGAAAVAGAGRGAGRQHGRRQRRQPGSGAGRRAAGLARRAAALDDRARGGPAKSRSWCSPSPA